MKHRTPSTLANRIPAPARGRANTITLALGIFGVLVLLLCVWTIAAASPAGATGPTPTGQYTRTHQPTPSTGPTGVYTRTHQPVAAKAGKSTERAPKVKAHPKPVSTAPHGEEADGCDHGATGKPCKDDPQPGHGKDCETHGNHGGVNEDHCTTVPPTTTTATVPPSTTTTTRTNTATVEPPTGTYTRTPPPATTTRTTTATITKSTTPPTSTGTPPADNPRELAMTGTHTTALTLGALVLLFLGGCAYITRRSTGAHH